jgi:hypothetical protein
MKCEIKYVPLSSLVISPIPLVLLIMGMVGGLLAFVISPNQMLEPMTPYTRALATGVFALIYMLLILSVMALSAFIYNVLSGLGLPGVKMNMDIVPESQEEGGEDSGETEAA